jgi:hypothetical protein
MTALLWLEPPAIEVRRGLGSPALSPFTSPRIPLKIKLQSAQSGNDVSHFLASNFIHDVSPLVSIALSYISHASAGYWQDTTCVPRTASFSGPWDSYNLAPSSRIVSPVSILNSDRNSHSSYPGTGSTSLKANGSLVSSISERRREGL